jgi:hypothetical protein
MLWLLGQDFSIMALIGLVLLIGIVKKNGILMIDFALEAQRQRPAAGGSDLRGLPHAVPADHHDHPRRPRRRAADARRGPAPNCASRWASRWSAVCW